MLQPDGSEFFSHPHRYTAQSFLRNNNFVARFKNNILGVSLALQHCVVVESQLQLFAIHVPQDVDFFSLGEFLQSPGLDDDLRNGGGAVDVEYADMGHLPDQINLAAVYLPHRNRYLGRGDEWL